MSGSGAKRLSTSSLASYNRETVDRATGGTGADTIDVEESPNPDGIDSVVGGDMADTVFVDPADLLI